MTSAGDGLGDKLTCVFAKITWSHHQKREMKSDLIFWPHTCSKHPSSQNSLLAPCQIQKHFQNPIIIHKALSGSAPHHISDLLTGYWADLVTEVFRWRSFYSTLNQIKVWWRGFKNWCWLKIQSNLHILKTNKYSLFFLFSNHFLKFFPLFCLLD